MDVSYIIKLQQNVTLFENVKLIGEQNGMYRRLIEIVEKNLMNWDTILPSISKFSQSCKGDSK